MALRASGHHRRGQKLYQKGDFKAAIEAFSEALDSKDADAIGVLDNRAATYCKLEQYDKARRDARNMIEKANQDERGYLRCAKVLLLDGKPDTALAIYEYGLNRLSSKHPRRDILDQQYKKLQDRILLHKRDPFTLLPLEIAMLVLQHFSFKQTVGIMRVCKGWQQFLTSISSIWLSIDLTGARGTVPFNTVRSYIRRSRGMLTQAIIQSLPAPQVPRSLEFLSRCPHIESLDLYVTYDHKEFLENFKRCKKLRNLLFSLAMPMPLDYVGRFFIEFKKLERITVWNCQKATRAGLPEELWPTHLPNLKSITLAASQPASTLEQIPVRLPRLISNVEPHPYQNLEELRLDWDPQVYTVTMFPEGFLTEIPEGVSEKDKAPPSLRHLHLHGIIPSPSIFSVLPETLESMWFSGGLSRIIDLRSTPFNTKFPALHTLSFNDTAWMTKANLELFLFDLKPPIRKLYLHQCFNLAWHEFLNILDMRERNPELAKLEELSLAHWKGVNDSDVSALRQLLPDLKVLDLSYTDITGCTIREFADSRASTSDNGAKLNRLHVRGCERISSDAIEYGKAKGLELVTRNFLSSSKAVLVAADYHVAVPPR